MLVAFLGTHAPLLVLVFYLLLGSSLGLGPALRILALMVVVTLVDTAATLLALRGLLAPISLTSSALKGYMVHRLHRRGGAADGQRAVRYRSARREYPLAGGFVRNGPPHRPPQPQAGREASGRRGREGQTQRGDAYAGRGGHQQLQAHKRYLRPPGGRHVHTPRSRRHPPQHPSRRLAGPLGRG